MAASDVIAEIGLDVTEFHKQLDSVTSRIEKAETSAASLNSTLSNTSSAADNAGKSAGKSGYRMGQLSMQLQDVAVQAQMGTSALTIFAQQGSQIASIFNGASGAMIGGGLAIGAAVASLANNADTSFKNIVREFQDMRSEISQGMSVMSMSELSNGLAKSEAKAKELTEAVNGTNIVVGFLKKEFADLASFASFGFLASGTEKIKADLEEQVAQIRLRKQIQEQALTVSDAETEIQAMKNTGDKLGVKLAEEKLRLRKEIAKINQSEFDESTQFQLKGKERKRSAAAVDAIYEEERKAAEAAQEEISKGLEKLDKQQADNAEKSAEKAQKASEKKIKAAEEWERFVADMEFRVTEEFFKEINKREKAEEKSRENLKKVWEKIEKDDIEENRKRIDKKIADEKRANEELKRLADKLRQDRIDAYGESPAAGRKFDKEQKQKEKDRKKGEERIERIEERERKKEEEKQKNAPKGAPKLGPEKPKPNGQPAPKPAPEPKGNKGMTMTVETLNVKLLQNA